MSLLWRLYRRRLVNVNINIVAAGLLALTPTVIIIHLFTRFAGFPAPKDYTQHQRYLIGGITFVSDIVLDVAVYYLLHWLANHLPQKAARPSHELEVAAHPTFIKDATQVQVERIALSPLFYLTALGGQHVMLHVGSRPTVATFAGFGAAILLTRVLHTLWMLRGERRRKKLAMAAVRPAP